MTDPVPSPELVARLWEDASAGRDTAPIGEIFNDGVIQAYAAGANDQLDADAQWVEREIGHGREWGAELRAVMRPKPPSLKERALADLNALAGYGRSADTIRRALEQLPD